MGNLIKRAILGLSLTILGSSFCFAASIGVNQFSGLDTQDPPNALQPSQSQDLLNVRLQPGGRSVHKRDGYGLFQAINSISTATIHGGYHFQQTGGQDVQLWGSDTGLFSSVSDGLFVKIATGTVGATWQCTDNLGFAYCVDSSGIDQLVKTDGTIANTSYIGGTTPSGTIITSTPLQLVLAGVSGNSSSVYVSSNNSFANFGSGPLPTDPYIEIINSPGSRITHLAYYFGNLYWWKDQSFGYISGSASQGTVGVVIISNQIGTLDNSSAFWNPTNYDAGNHFNPGGPTTSAGNPYFNELQQLGGIFFRGQDGHIYQYDGYALTRISRIITPNVTSSNFRKQNSWTQSSAIDFNGGSGYSTFADTTTMPGNVILYGLSDSLQLGISSWTILGGSPNNNQNGIFFGGTSTPASLNSIAAPNLAQINKVATQFIFNRTDNDNLTMYVGKVNSSINGYYVSAQPHNAGGNFTISCGKITAHDTYSQLASGTAVGNPAVLGTDPHTIELQTTSTLGDMACRFDGNTVVSFNDTSYSNMNLGYLGGNAPNSTAYNVNAFNFDITNTTGTYYSAVNNAPNIVTFSNFTSNDQTMGGSLAYYTRSSTNAFSVTSSTPAWISQIKNSTVATSSATYFQARIDFSVVYPTATLALNDFTFNWFEGKAADKAYIQYFQDAILFSVSSSSSTSTNNVLFYLDLLNNTWLKDNIPANGFAVENNALYIGDPLSASVYKFGGVATDKGSAIQSYWKSMDFTGQDPTVQNDYDQADFAFGESSNTITFTYQTDQNSLLTIAKPVSLYSPTSTIVKRGFALDKKAIGTYFNFMVGDNSSLSPWTLMGERTTYNPLSWRPQESN